MTYDAEHDVLPGDGSEDGYPFAGDGPPQDDGDPDDWTQCQHSGCGVWVYIHDQRDPENPRCDDHAGPGQGDRYR